MSGLRPAARALRLGAALAVAAAAAGCGGGDRRGDPADPRMKRIAEHQAFTREVARGLAPLFAADATEVLEALRSKNGAGADAAKKRIDDEQLALEALEDAEQALELARRFYGASASLDLSTAERARLDETVGRMAEGAEMLATSAAALVRASRKRDAAEVERLRKEGELLRAALRAFRTDLAIASRLGPAPALGKP